MVVRSVVNLRLVMTADICECGHYDYDHVNMRNACDVSYCVCQSFSGEEPIDDSDKLGTSELTDN